MQLVVIAIEILLSLAQCNSTILDNKVDSSTSQWGKDTLESFTENLKREPSMFNTPDLRFYLYQRPNINTSILLDPNNPYQINPQQTIKMFIHGAFSNGSQDLNLRIKTAYLQRYDYNAIMADWAVIANGDYLNIVEKTPHLGNLLATFLCNLHQKLNMSLTQVHLIGHSAGAHVAGAAGKTTPKTCGQKIYRITGLDPAGPIYQELPESRTLRASDAEFVDVMHTNALMSGYYGNVGTVDFHVNCGIRQNGCPDRSSVSKDLMMDITDILGCSHMRALSYWTESIGSNNFIAQSCTFCPEVCLGDIHPEYIIMGEDCPRNSTHKIFWIPTNGTSPYGIACSPYPHECTL